MTGLYVALILIVLASFVGMFWLKREGDRLWHEHRQRERPGAAAGRRWAAVSEQAEQSPEIVATCDGGFPGCCDACHGTGYAAGEPCSDCYMTGHPHPSTTPETAQVEFGGVYGPCGHSEHCSGDGPDCWPACSHEWLDRPESDTRECLICGEER